MRPTFLAAAASSTGGALAAATAPSSPLLRSCACMISAVSAACWSTKKILGWLKTGPTQTGALASSQQVKAGETKRILFFPFPRWQHFGVPRTLGMAACSLETARSCTASAVRSSEARAVAALKSACSCAWLLRRASSSARSSPFSASLAARSAGAVSSP